MIKEKLHIDIQDLIINIKFKENTYNLYLPIGVIKDGYIQDYNQLYYLLNKFLKEKNIKNNCKVKISLCSSDIFYEKMDIPLIEEEEIRSLLYYELNEKFSSQNYAYEFIKSEINSKFYLDIFIVPKKLIKDYSELFNKLSLNLVQIDTVFNKFSTENNYIILNITNSIIFINSEKFTFNKIIFDKEFYEVMEKFNVNYEDICYIIGKSIKNDSTSYELKKLKDKILILIKNRLELIDFIKNRSENIYYNGDCLLDYLNNNVLINDCKILESVEIFADSKINFIKLKNKDLKKLLLYLSLLILVNFTIFLKLNSNLNNIENELSINKNKLSVINKEYNSLDKKGILDENKRLKKEEKENIKKQKLLDNNRVFTKLLSFLENYNNEDILFLDFDFNKNIIFVSGIAKNNEIIDEVVSKIDYDVNIINSFIEDNVINFKFKIDLGDL